MPWKVRQGPEWNKEARLVRKSRALGTAGQSELLLRQSWFDRLDRGFVLSKAVLVLVLGIHATLSSRSTSTSTRVEDRQNLSFEG